jgi:hypothetical protein
MGYVQFPSYIATIECGKTENDIFILTQKLIINISLMCPFYTIYYEDHFKFTGYKAEAYPPDFRIFYSEKTKKTGFELFLFPLCRKK